MKHPAMSLSLFIFLVIRVSRFTFLGLSFLSYASAAMLGNETDKLALLEFKSQMTEDPRGVLASWNGSVHFCKWAGVACGLKHQRVTALDLRGQRLAGTISPNIGNLSFLQLLDLADNSFHGGIPLELSHLIRLRTLNLSYNFLEGEIPVNLSHCSNLVNLILDHNYLIHHIPPELGSLSKLVKLYLKNNRLTGGFPTSVGNLTSLQELYLSYNNLTGEVPATIAQMRSLIELGLSVNSLSGEFPLALYNLSSLELIALSFNNFTGGLRSNIGSAFPNLQKLYLGSNNFTGTIPISLSNASDLLQIDFPRNKFIGGVPMSLGKLQNLRWLNLRNNHLGSATTDDLIFLTSLANCSQLQFLDFSDNQFGGILPHSITNLSTQVLRLLLGGNYLEGSIPVEIANLVNLNYLRMDQNFLKGTIPATIGQLSNLKNLDLGSNQLTGEIPSFIGNITQLLYLYLENNSLEGSIPLSFGKFKHLQILGISQNKLNSTIPKQLMALTSLTTVNVSYNSLIGRLPEEVGNLTYLVSLDVSNNKLSGDIPGTLGSCLALEEIYMQGNWLQGAIPYLGGLRTIQYLDLSSNNLSSQIPSYMVNLPYLLFLNLSFNNLEGEVPAHGVFKNASAVEVFGNAGLCGGIKELNMQQCPVPKTKHHKKHIALKFIIVIVSVASCSVLLLLLLLLYRNKKRSKDKPLSTFTSTHFYPKISYEELLNATGGFSSRNLLGSGNFGSVYKGNLRPNDTIVAIKILNLQEYGSSKSFIAECQALRNTRHRNLVKVITACSSIDFEGKDFKALVYQYMPNGSLEEWLHPEGQVQQKNLNLLQRINIAVDVASALHYLHHLCQTSVVHCDIKPSNVLLDEDLTAHVSDFGLARLISRFSKEPNQSLLSSLGVKGTIGYAAPEYGMGCEVSTQGDVYSFGILLLEMFTGRRPSGELVKDDLNLHNFVKLSLPGKVMEIVDQSAFAKRELEADKIEASCELIECGVVAEADMNCLISILQIGVACSVESPKQRMNMRQVSTQLISIREEFLRTGMHKEQVQSLERC